jgi:hypothetical protein
MSSQYKRLKLSKTGLVSAHQLAPDEPQGRQARAEADGSNDQELNLADIDDDLPSVARPAVKRVGAVLDDDSDDGAPAPERVRPPNASGSGKSIKKRRKISKKADDDGAWEVRMQPSQATRQQLREDEALTG